MGVMARNAASFLEVAKTMIAECGQDRLNKDAAMRGVIGYIAFQALELYLKDITDTISVDNEHVHTHSLKRIISSLRQAMFETRTPLSKKDIQRLNVILSTILDNEHTFQKLSFGTRYSKTSIALFQLTMLIEIIDELERWTRTCMR